MSKKLTVWFPANVKPLRNGVYQTIEPCGLIWSNLFKDGRWYFGHGFSDPDQKFIDRAYLGLHVMSSDEETMYVKAWRGLASDPSKGNV